MEALHKGEVDAIPEVKRIGILYSEQNNWNVKPIGGPIFGLNVGTGFSQELDTSVVDRYNVALKALIDSGFIDNLYSSYFGE
jgi:ABC-type amino acid transport substrate-binding protein